MSLLGCEDLNNHILTCITMNQAKGNLNSSIIFLGILFYFFLSACYTLVQSIYVLDLLNLELDAKALGVLFFFSSILILLIPEVFENTMIRASAISLALFHAITPFVATSTSLLFSGLAVGSYLIFLPLLLKSKVYTQIELIGSVIFGLLFSVFFRTLNSGWDITVIGTYRYIPIVFSLIIILWIGFTNLSSVKVEQTITTNLIIPEILSIFAIVELIYFAYGSPVVFSTWTMFNYPIIVILLTLTTGVFFFLLLLRPDILENLTRPIILIWNTVFFLSLILVILLNQVKFISNTSDSPIIVSSQSTFSHILLILNLILSPIIYIDISTAISSLYRKKVTKGNLVSSFVIAEFLFVILIFSMIFSNVWGYVEPISTLFRGLFWLPFSILAVLAIICYSVIHYEFNFQHYRPSQIIVASIIILILLLGSLTAAVFPYQSLEPTKDSNQLRLMTYNIQQGVDINGNINLERQLEKIKEVNPDILGLQESDIAKINTANIDVVRYFADNLGYYSYYGPSTVMQTFGVALLSRYPIENAFSFYTLGNEDEIGSLSAQITYQNIKYNIFVNHPAGSDESKLDHIINLLDLADGKDNVIMMGDFNWREYSLFYNLTIVSYIDTWRAIWPTGFDDAHLNMSSTIDHIFISPDLIVTNARYIPSPASETDHPLLYIDIVS